MLNILTSKTYEIAVLGTLGIALVIVASLNMKMKVLKTKTDPVTGEPFPDANAGDVYCIEQNETVSDINKAAEQEKHTSQKAVAMLWIAFISGILLILHSFILTISIFYK